MSQRKTFFPALVCALLLLTVGQTRVAATTPPPLVTQTGALAVVNNQPITLSDLDPQVVTLVNNLEREIAEARRFVLDEQINMLLFEAEAKRRRMSVPQLLNLEVSRKIPAPTAQQIQAVYDANRAQFGVADLKAARPQIVSYLRYESEQKLILDFAARLRRRVPVVMGVDINSPNLKPGAVLATVAGRTVLASSITERLKPIIYDLRLRAYEAQQAAVEQAIYDRLILDEARKRGVGPEAIIRTEINEKLSAPSEEEVVRFYEENRARISVDLATARQSIINHLEQQRQLALERALGQRLRAAASVRVLLAEPEPPVLAVSADDDPSHGARNAPVTVVVFTDFQCPSCAYNHPLIEETLKAYGNRTRLVIRDFPLDTHADARKAAEAANAAHAQGKFFEYIGLLFKNQKALDVASLKKYATQVGLNRARFDAALDGGTYAAEVSHDVAEGIQYGVMGTPTVFVNGVRVRVLNSENLRAAIDRALAGSTAPQGGGAAQGR